MKKNKMMVTMAVAVMAGLAALLWSERPTEAQTTNAPGVTLNVPGLPGSPSVLWHYVQAGTNGVVIWPTTPLTWAATNVAPGIGLTNGALIFSSGNGLDFVGTGLVAAPLGIATVPYQDVLPPHAWHGDFAHPSINSLLNRLVLYTGSNNVLVVADSSLSNPLVITNGTICGNAAGLTNHVFNQVPAVPTNAVPGSTAGSTTNWLLVDLNGVPTLVATNNVSPYGWLTKALWPLRGESRNWESRKQKERMMENKFNTLMGGKELVIWRLAEGAEREETVRVRQLPIKLYPRMLECVDDEAALVELYCDQPKGWAETLSLDSFEAIVAEADKLNADFFSRWVARRLGRMERVKPGITERMLGAASSSLTTPPKSP